MTTMRVDELRDQRQIHDRRFRIQQVGDQAHPEQLHPRVPLQLVSLEQATTTGFQRLPRQIPQIRSTRGLEPDEQPRHRDELRAEIAEVIRWLACDAPPSTTGAVIDANGASYVR